MQKTIWLSYDLSVQGDYSSLYEWLDNIGAKECGNSVAFFKYEIDQIENLTNELEKDISSKVELGKRDRIYIIFGDSENNMKGAFLFGKRKSSPWQGYGNGEDEIDE